MNIHKQILHFSKNFYDFFLIIVYFELIIIFFDKRILLFYKIFNNKINETENKKSIKKVQN